MEQEIKALTKSWYDGYKAENEFPDGYAVDIGSWIDWIAKQHLLKQCSVSGSLETWLRKRIALMKKKQSGAIDIDKKVKAGVKLRAYKECLDYILSHRSQ